jgi:hypothetical protein
VLFGGDREDGRRAQDTIALEIEAVIRTNSGYKCKGPSLPRLCWLILVNTPSRPSLTVCRTQEDEIEAEFVMDLADVGENDRAGDIRYSLYLWHTWDWEQGLFVSTET